MGRPLTRRRFSVIAVSALATGCAGGVTLRGVRSGDAVFVSLDRAAALAAPGSTAVVLADDGTPAVVVHGENGEFRAFDAVCPHLGCTVRAGEHHFSCPCHGSTFDLEGRVVRGPAPEGLRELPVTRQNDTLSIQVR